MKIPTSGYSPNINIYLDINGEKIRLADVLHTSATLYDNASIPPGTKANLIFVIDGEKEQDEIVLTEGISQDSQVIQFTYINPDRM